MSTAPSVAAGFSFAAATHSRHAASVSPSTGSTWMLAIASGFSSATCSISTPPCAESIPRCSLAARSSVNEA